MITKFRDSHSDRVFYLCLTIFLISLLGNSPLVARQAIEDHSKSNAVVIELFYRSDSDQSQNAKQFLSDLSQRRPGIEVKAYDVLTDQQQLKRLWQLSKQFGYEQAKVPTFFLCNRLQIGFPNPQASGAEIEDLLTIKAYVRPGCKHCQAGKEFLDRRVTYTGLEANKLPVAVIGADKTTGAVGLVVQFDGTESSDVDGDILVYEWDFGDGSPVSTELRPTHTYVGRGMFVVELVVTDPLGQEGRDTITLL